MTGQETRSVKTEELRLVSSLSPILLNLCSKYLTKEDPESVWRLQNRRTIKRWIYPITGLDRPLGLQQVEDPRISGCQAYIPNAFIPRSCPWESFLLEAESTPGL
jgi:hypothetical protein